MGLFDMFKGDAEQALTPKLTFAASMIYMVGVDGQIEEEEIGQLISAIGGDRALLENALKYVRKTPVDAFLQKAPASLSKEQRLFVLTNLCDSLLSDGSAAPQEQALFGRFMSAFEVSEESFRPQFEVIALKNNRNVLGA